MNNYNVKDIGEFINVGTGKDLTINELSGIVKEIVGFKGQIKWDNSKPDGTPQKLLNVERLHKLGWHEQTSLFDGISSYHRNYSQD